MVHRCRRPRIPRITVIVPTAARRTLFGFSRSTPKATKLADVDPGYQILTGLHNRLVVGERTPPTEDVIQAFNAFFRYKESLGLPMQKHQVETALRAFLHIQKTNIDTEGFGFLNADLRRALRVMSYMTKDQDNTVHSQLATLLYEELEHRRLTSGESQEEVDPSAGKGSILAKNLRPYLRSLAYSGKPMQARTLVEQYFESDLRSLGDQPWRWIVVGFLWQEQEDEVLRTLSTMRSFDIPMTGIHQLVTTHYANLGDLKSTKWWYSTMLDTMPSLATYEAVLNLCIRKNDYEWGDSVFRTIFEKRNIPKKAWSMIFRWSAAKGKGVDEIDRMMNVMRQRNEALSEGNLVTPDIAMINDLIELAMSKDDPYSAERYVALGQKWNLEPDARTHLLQLDYRLKVGDLDGARAAYARLREEDTSDDNDIPLMNKLIVALYEKQQSYNTIMSIVEDLTERQATFEAPTVAALCQLHLRRGELDQVTTLLSTYARNYSISQQESIRDVFVDFILDRKNPNLSAWEAYTILSPKFAETPVSIRTRIMSEFFSRGRSDMGLHVFGHMRQQLNRSVRPTGDTYAECFQGIARAGGKVESLHLVHNMLKVDPEIEPNTRLSNSLMLAYTACGNASRALEFWNDIAHSREGPTYNSIQIALQACAVAPFGERQARDIWARVRRFGIQVTREIYAAYIGALSGQGAFKECIGLIENAEADAGFKPDALMVGTFYNTAPGLCNKEQVEAWAKKAYPDVWEELLTIGRTVTFKRDALEDAGLEGDALEDTGLEGELEHEGLVFDQVSVFNIARSVEA